MSKTVVLAFSGGLDTSFCVPYLREKGYEVVTAFIDTGGVPEAERTAIEARAIELGAKEHRTIDIGEAIGEEFVVPLLAAGQFYQGQYPLLCSDRYLIVQRCLALCDELGTKLFAHGCTGMGNDQVRFDLSVKCLGDYEIIAPIREIQNETSALRAYEQEYLKERGFDTPGKAGHYTINENLLGVTLSGGEVDEWQAPGPDSYHWCKPPALWPNDSFTVKVTFEQGKPVALDGKAMSVAAILAELNDRLAPYGIGRGLYTGDTTIGLKGRIVFECPGITALHRAHRALEETVLTRAQNHFKPTLAQKWVELVYQGFYFEPLRQNLETSLLAMQDAVTGEVELGISGGQCVAQAVSSDNMLLDDSASYAQSAGWSAAEALGFIHLLGRSSELWAGKHRAKKGADG
jgi:argininosuccinate synthase